MWNYMIGVGASHGMPLFLGLLWIFLGAILVAVVWGIARSGNQKLTSRTDRALRVLQKRYAKGEIGRDEFEQQKRDLGG